MNNVDMRTYGLPTRTPTTNRPTTTSSGGGYMTRRKLRSSPRKRGSFDSSSPLAPPSSRRRRSGRGSSSLWDLARFIQEGKKVVFVTGAGLSVASGVRAFRTTNDSSSLYSSDMAWKNNRMARGVSSSSGTVGGARTSQRRAKSNTSCQGKKGLVEEQPLGIWNSVLWTQAKRETFRKDPLVWWNEFWLRYFPVEDYENKYSPNAGHLALAALQLAFSANIKIITQNVDGLQHSALDQQEADEETIARLKDNIVEAHGRLGLYKCLPADDSDTDSSSDEDDDRPVHLGHRRKYRAWKRKQQIELSSVKKQPKDHMPQAPASVTSTDVSSGSSISDSVGSPCCRYQMLESLTVDQLGPPSVREALRPKSKEAKKDSDAVVEWDSTEKTANRSLLTTAPCCPSCGNKVLPQSLLFDEGYHSHEHYKFTKMEDWLAEAEVLVFVGTSFAVTLPLVALDHAREVNLPVFNFNVSDMLDSSTRLNAENITGPSQETLPKLWQAVQYLVEEEYAKGL